MDIEQGLHNSEMLQYIKETHKTAYNGLNAAGKIKMSSMLVNHIASLMIEATDEFDKPAQSALIELIEALESAGTAIDTIDDRRLRK